MMLVRSIPLSAQTMDAWRLRNGWFPRRDRDFREAMELYVQRHPDRDAPIVNLGLSTWNPSWEDFASWDVDMELVFNIGDNIQPLIRPGDARRLLGDLMPERPTLEGSEPLWVKAPGMGGRGKQYISDGRVPRIPDTWDIQVHIEGTEYRVITVRDKVVQVSERHGENGNRTYEWIGVKAAPQEVKDIAKEGAQRLEGQNIIGWDIIVGDKAYVLEGNSSPGVNGATVGRIVDSIFGRSYDDAS